MSSEPSPPGNVASITDEMFAAFIDGTLPPHERDRVLSLVATSEELRRRLASTAEILALREEEGVASGPPPPPPSGTNAPSAPPKQRPTGDDDASPVVATGRTARALNRDTGPRPASRWNRTALAGFLLAACVATVVILRREPSSVEVATPDLAWLAGQSLPPQWNAIGWSNLRGAADVLTPRQRSVRLGVAAVDWQVAALMSDSATGASARATLGGLVAALPAGGPLATEITATTLVGGPARADATPDRRLRDVAALVESPPWYEIAYQLAVRRLQLMSSSRSGGSTAPAPAADWRPVLRSLDSLAAIDSLDPVAWRVAELLRREAIASKRGAPPATLRALLDSALIASGS